jgi:hypothetical protein
MTFHILGISSSTDFHIFQRGSNHQPETIPSFKWFMIVLPTLMRADIDNERSSRAWGLGYKDGGFKHQMVDNG